MMNASSNPAPKPGPKTRRGARRWLLFASLALNLLVIGAVAGALLWGPGRGPHRELRHLGGGPFISALPRDEARALGREIRDQAAPLRENRAALRDRVGGVLAALEATPFDAAALRAALAQTRAAAEARQRLVEDLLVARLERMSPEARADYAARLVERLGRARPPR